MRFFAPVLVVVAAFTALVSAQSATGTSPPAPVATDSKDNQINYPVGGTVGSGSPITIKWTPSTQGPVTLVLRKGDGNNLDTITTIASGIPNSGSYDWTPSPSLTAGDDYAIQIISGGVSNYSPKFGIGPLTSSSSSSTSTSTSTRSSSSSSSSLSSSSTTTPSSSSSASASATQSGVNTTVSSTSRTSSPSTPTPSSSGAPGGGGATSLNGAAQVASPLAFIFFIAAGVAYLN